MMPILISNVFEGGQDASGLNIQIIIESQEVVDLIQGHPNIMVRHFLRESIIGFDNHIPVLFPVESPPSSD